MILDEYTEASQEGITFTKAMSSFEVDGISYTPPYALPWEPGRQVSRQMISLMPDGEGGPWLLFAANTELHDLDDDWDDDAYDDELSDGAIAVPQG